MKKLLAILLTACTLNAGTTVEVPAKAVTEQPRAFSLWDATQAYALLSYSFDTEEFGAGVRLAYNINDHVRIRADYVSELADFANGERFGADSNVSLAFLYPVDAVPGLELYTITGLGVTDFENPALELIAGVGIEYHFRDAWHAFSEYQYSSEEQDSVVRLGIGVTF